MTMADAFEKRFSEFFAETRQGLLRYVRRLTRTNEAAEDIVQEAYARTLEQGQQVQTPKAFLFVTARNLAWNAHRNQRTAATDPVGNIDQIGVVEEVGASPEEQLITNEASDLLRQAVERLPGQCRTAFTLRIFHGCSYKEIAERLGISTKTVEKHIARGLRDTHAFMRRRYRLPDKGAG
jgi:RNA polymerase sigma-70 factor (ECF subfamily)